MSEREESLRRAIQGTAESRRREANKCQGSRRPRGHPAQGAWKMGAVGWYREEPGVTRGGRGTGGLAGPDYKDCGFCSERDGFE